MTIFLGKLSSFLGQEYVRIPGPYFQKVSIPILKDIPYIGPSLFDQNAIVLFSFLMIPFCWYMIEKTRWGLIIKAVGENPVSAENRGIDPEILFWYFSNHCIKAPILCFRFNSSASINSISSNDFNSCIYSTI